MTASRLDGSDAANVRLRSMVSRVDGAMSSLLSGGAAVPDVLLDDLLESWAELVEVLALSGKSERPACPVCGRPGPWASADGLMTSSASQSI